MRPIVVSAGPLASASATNIRTASSIAGAGAVTLNGSTVSAGVATLDVARRVIFTSSADDTGITFIITGTNWAGDTVSETVTGVNNAAASTVLSYKTVTAVSASGASAGTVSIGTNTVADSPWIRLDSWADATVALQCNASGTVNYTVQASMDDPNSAANPVSPSAMTWINDPDLNFVGQTANAQGSYSYAPTFLKVVLNSGTGSVSMTAAQSSSVPY